MGKLLYYYCDQYDGKLKFEAYDLPIRNITVLCVHYSDTQPESENDTPFIQTSSLKQSLEEENKGLEVIGPIYITSERRKAGQSLLRWTSKKETSEVFYIETLEVIKKFTDEIPADVKIGKETLLEYLRKEDPKGFLTALSILCQGYLKYFDSRDINFIQWFTGCFTKDEEKDLNWNELERFFDLPVMENELNDHRTDVLNLIYTIRNGASVDDSDIQSANEHLNTLLDIRHNERISGQEIMGGNVVIFYSDADPAGNAVAKALQTVWSSSTENSLAPCHPFNDISLPEEAIKRWPKTPGGEWQIRPGISRAIRIFDDSKFDRFVLVILSDRSAEQALGLLTLRGADLGFQNKSIVFCDPYHLIDKKTQGGFDIESLFVDEIISANSHNLIRRIIDDPDAKERIEKLFAKLMNEVAHERK